MIFKYSDFILNEKMALINYDTFAKLVVDAYNEAPDHDTNCHKSWDALLKSSNNWKKKLLSDIKLELVDTEQYDSAEGMRKRVKKEGIMYVTKEYENHRYWSDDDYRTFRAVHDYVVHCLGRNSFSLKGEMQAVNLHMRLIPKEAKPALFMEIVGNVCHKIVTDTFPAQIKIADLTHLFDPDAIGTVKGHEIKNRQLL